MTIKNAVFWDVMPFDSYKNDVSEERIDSIIRVTRIYELGITLAIINNRSTLLRNTMLRLLITDNVPSSLILVTLMVESIRSVETSVLNNSHTAEHPRRRHI
jgi:hypothetical protein